MAGEAPVLEMRGITKAFPGIVANDHVDFELLPGEVHALLGENGAGKSTLMNVASGTTAPDAGTIIFDGSPVENLTPAMAHDLGIAIVSPLDGLRKADLHGAKLAVILGG